MPQLHFTSYLRGTFLLAALTSVILCFAERISYAGETPSYPPCDHAQHDDPVPDNPRPHDGMEEHLVQMALFVNPTLDTTYVVDAEFPRFDTMGGTRQLNAVGFHHNYCCLHDVIWHPQTQPGLWGTRVRWSFLWEMKLVNDDDLLIPDGVDYRPFLDWWNSVPGLLDGAEQFGGAHEGPDYPGETWVDQYRGRNTMDYTEQPAHLAALSGSGTTTIRNEIFLSPVTKSPMFGKSIQWDPDHLDVNMKEVAFSVKVYFYFVNVGSSCPADLADDDHNVNVNDLFVLLSNWNTAGPGASLAPDDNVVDVFDLFELLSSWGDCD